MRLRPSGRSGPAAVMLSSFEDHHHNRAYNWEHIALAHSRIVAGNIALGDKVIAIRDAVLARPRDKAQFHSDALTMWQRISDQRISNTAADVYNSKLRTGGLMQAEYSEACHIILGEDSTDFVPAIAFWSHLQLWERLLGLTDKALTQTPRFYTPNLLSQFSIKDFTALQKQQSKHSKTVQKAFDARFKNAKGQKSTAKGWDEARIIWTD